MAFRSAFDPPTVSFNLRQRDDTGEFTIEVEREGEQIKFHGFYTDPTKGTFNG